MALVNIDKNYIFFHIYKCGGMSIRALLKGEEMLGQHCHAMDLALHCVTQGLVETWERAYKFTFVRNPFDWQVSLYFYIQRSPTHRDYNFVNTHSLFEYLQFQRDTRMTAPRPHGSNKYDTLTGFLTDHDGKFLVDHIFRYEDFEGEIRRMCMTIGEPLLYVPQENVSMNRERDYRQYYDAKTRALLEEMFSDDLKHFDYGF